MLKQQQRFTIKGLVYIAIAIDWTSWGAINILMVSLIYNSSACDVKYMNTLFFEQFEDCEIHIVENMEYEHTVHPNSIYLQTYMKTWNVINTVNKRFTHFLIIS